MTDAPLKVIFKGLPDERITVEHYLQNFADSRPVPIEKHTHDYCELVYVRNGICEHTYKDSKMTLMSNDVLLVMPNQAHEFVFSEHIDIYNCQFYLEELSGIYIDIVNNLNFPNLRTAANDSTGAERIRFTPEVVVFPPLQPTEQAAGQAASQSTGDHFAPLNMQGIIHTSYAQARQLESLFEKIMAEQADRLLRYQDVVKNILGEALIIIERIMADQFMSHEHIPKKHQAIIENVLRYLDANFSNQLNFNDIAAAQDLSPNYFRKIFKTYTGTSPVDHLNRIRVLKALDLLRDHRNFSSSDVAEQVGIFDANYFTRLFKKYIGYPPSHFRQV